MTNDAPRVPEGFEDVLEGTGFAHVATLGPRGEPQSSPVWYEWDGESLIFSHTTSRQKYRNLMRDPRIAVSILDSNDPYRYVEIRGRADIKPDPEKELIHRLAQKYLGTPRFESERPENVRVVVRVRPERVIVHG